MSKFKRVFGATIRGTVVAVQAIAAVMIPARFGNAAVPNEGAHRQDVSTDRGMRFDIDERAQEMLAATELYVQLDDDDFPGSNGRGRGGGGFDDDGPRGRAFDDDNPPPGRAFDDDNLPPGKPFGNDGPNGRPFLDGS